jgi:hypothetical protein
MDLGMQAFLWSIIPIAVLLVIAAGAYWYLRKRPVTTESSQLRVAEAYLAATSQTAQRRPAGLGGPAGLHSAVGGT